MGVFFFAAAVYGAFFGYGSRSVFLFGIIPLIAVIIGRVFIREPERYRHLQRVKEARREGDEEQVQGFLQEYDIKVE